MTNMRSMSTRRAVVIEDHAVQFEVEDFAKALETQCGVVAPTMAVALVYEEEVQIGSVAGNLPRTLTPAQILDLARLQNPAIPEDAEVVISVRWRKEVDATSAPVTGVPAAARVQSPQSPMSVAAGRIAPEDLVVCATCGGQPGIEGPSPDCEDAQGCGRVRVIRGNLPIPTSLEPSAPPSSAQGALAALPRPPQPTDGQLINRATGQRAWAGTNGQPYGVHDYEPRR